MKPSIHQFTFPTAIDLSDYNKVFAIHHGMQYLTILIPCRSEMFSEDILRRIVWFQLDIPSHRDTVRNILSASPDYHLVTLSTVLKQHLET
jgi:hypothetical protein